MPDSENDSIIAKLAAYISTKFKHTTSTILIAVGGPGGCGKSFFCKKLSDALTLSATLSLDNYRLPRKEREKRNLFGSHPDANRIDLLLEHIDALRHGKQIDYPIYDTVSGTIVQDKTLTPKQFVLLDGEIAAYTQIITRSDFSIHLDADRDVLFARRVRRDVEQHGYCYEKVKAVFEQSMRDNATYGTYGKEHADINIVSKDAFTLDIRKARCGLKI